MKVAILGAGAIGFTSAALLAEKGHEPVLWSPSGRRTVRLAAGEPLRAVGAISFVRQISVAETIENAISGADAILVAVDAAGHKTVLEAAAPHLRDGQTVIISAAYALSALHLSKALHERKIKAPIVSWSATIATAHQESLTDVNVRLVRPALDIAAFGESRPGEGLEVCEALFGARFRQKDSALEIALLANSNPVFHVPVTVLNLSRVDTAEQWVTYERTTASVSRLVEALDAERVDVGTACGFVIPSVNEHFHKSFDVPLASIADIMATLFKRGLKARGASNLDHRHLSQDIPHGLVFTAMVGKAFGVSTRMHESMIAIASAATGRNYWDEALDAFPMDCENIAKEDMMRVSQYGWT